MGFIGAEPLIKREFEPFPANVPLAEPSPAAEPVQEPVPA
jgi:hypothetical protein